MISQHPVQSKFGTVSGGERRRPRLGNGFFDQQEMSEEGTGTVAVDDELKDLGLGRVDQSWSISVTRDSKSKARLRKVS
jgi:hypothetical protein